nr:MAG TPA: hypothetical protein [Caudoviricetes sp.]
MGKFPTKLSDNLLGCPRSVYKYKQIMLTIYLQICHNVLTVL